MKFCDGHWTALREAVMSRGLGHLVAANGRDAAARTMADVQGRAEPDDFEPLLSVTWMVYGKALRNFGPAMLAADVCPICEALRLHPDPCPHGCTAESYERWWIDGPADAVLAMAKEKGLVAA